MEDATVKGLNTTEGTNRFRYQSFRERVKSVKIDVTHRVVQHYEKVEEEDGSYFVDGIARWQDLNCTGHFTQFLRDVRPLSSSLVQLLHHKDTIVRIILRHIEVENSLAWEPLLDLTTCLVRDLQDECFPHFHQIFTTIVHLLETPDLKLTELVFNTLAYLFKYLARNLLADINATFDLLAPLLSERKEFIRRFAAEAFGSLLRKLPKDTADAVYKHIFDFVWESSEESAVQGASLLFSESLKQVQGTLHSRAPTVFKKILMVGLDERAEGRDAAVRTLEEFIQLLAHHTKSENLVPMWKILLDEFESELTRLQPDSTTWRLEKLLSLGQTWAGLRGGEKVHDHDLLYKCVQRMVPVVLKTPAGQDSLKKAFAEFLGELLFISSSSEVFTYGKAVFDVLFASEDVVLVLSFCELLRGKGWMSFPQVVLPGLLSYMQRTWLKHEKEFVLFLATLFENNMEQFMPYIPHSVKTTENLIRFPVVQGQKKSVDVVDRMLEALSQDFQWEQIAADLVKGGEKCGAIGMVAAICSSIPFLACPPEKLLETVQKVLFSLCSNISKHKSSLMTEELLMLSSLAGVVLSTLAKCAGRSGSSAAILEISALVQKTLIPTVGSNVIALRGIADYLECLQSMEIAEKHLTVEHLDAALPHLVGNLGSVVSEVRLQTLRILCTYKQHNLRPIRDSILTGPCDLLPLCMSIEQTPATVATIRETTFLLRRLEVLIRSQTIPRVYVEVPTRYVLALLTIPFTPLWAEATKTLHVIGNAVMETFWPIFREVLTESRHIGKSASNASGGDLLDITETVVTDSPMDIVEAHTASNIDQELVVHLQGLVTFSAAPFDMQKYHSILVRILAGLPQLIEKQSWDIVPLFLGLFNDEATHTSMEQVTKATNLASASSVEIQEGARVKVVEFLAAFAKLRHPQKLYKSEVVYSICLQLLCKGDDRLQQLALDCLMAWKLPGMDHIGEALKRMSVDDTFRDALSTLNMEDVYANVEARNRPALMDILVRILYGKLISRRGRASASGLAARRAAIFAFFTGVDNDVLSQMVNLTVQPFAAIVTQSDLNSSGEFEVNPTLSSGSLGSLKRQIGFLHVLEDSIKQLRSLLVPFLPKLLKVLLYVLHAAEVEATAEDGDEHSGHIAKQQKEVRQLGIRRLKELFEANLDFDFSPYVGAIFRAFINKRIPNFEEENTQATSSLLELFLAWSKDLRYVTYLVDHSPEVVPKVISVLSATKVKPVVVSCVLTIVESILELGEDQANGVIEKVLRPHVQTLLLNLNAVLSQTFGERGSVILIGQTIPARIIRILANLSVYVTDGDSATKLLDMMLPYTKRPPIAVPEGTKLEIIQILTNFLPILPALQGVSPVDTPYFSLASHLFDVLETREARAALITVFERFADLDGSLRIVSDLVLEINAQSVARMDEPDFNRRFAAFARINQELYLTLTATQWLPLLHNLLFYVQERDEFSIRTSASFGVSQFVTRASQLDAADIRQPAFMNLINHVILPSIKRGVKLNSAVVRSEFVNLLGQLVVSFPVMSAVSDMHGLLANGDEEASFFTNIYHLQVHRRVRALRRLAEECATGNMSAANVSNYFVPIVAHFIFESDRVSDHNLINDAVSTLAACAAMLTWGHYWALFKRFLNAMSHRPELEKVLNRVIISLLDGFHFELEAPDAAELALTVAKPEETKVSKVVAETAPQDPEVAMDIEELTVAEASLDLLEAADEEEETEEAPAIAQGNTGSKFQAKRVHGVVIHKLLPTLQKYVEKQDDNTIPMRIPLALAIAKLLQKLPSTSMQVPLAKLITTMCNFLRHRGQDARDCTRETLVKVAVLLGPTFFPFILKELEGALTRGYQLHVLGFTVHSILMNLVPLLKPGDLDPCVDQVVSVCVADIFGEAGAEREVMELRGKMREIKTTKSFDSLELISKAISFKLTGRMLLPLKELMLETNSAQVTRKIDDIFRRLALGLNTNSSVEDRELMVFVHELVTENLPLSQSAAPQVKRKSAAEKNFTVQLKRGDPLEPIRYFQANAHMFIEFGLSLLLTALRSEKISTRNPQHLSMLDPLVELLGRSLYSKHSGVSTQALRVLAIIAISPLPSLKPTMPIIVRRLFDILGKSFTANEELTKATFRLLTLIIRDCKYVSISESQLILVLNVVRPDLETQAADRQGTAFSLIRAILTRKIVVKEMYDLMEVVAKTLVTSQSSQVRELSRQAHVQFLLEYPQGPNRLKKQMTYLVKNLSYDHESGRESVLQMLNTIIVKFSDAVLFEYADLLFLALVMSLVNDESAKCRALAGKIICELVPRLDATRFAKVLELIETWFQQDQQPQLQRTAAQVSGLILGAAGDREQKWIPTFLRLLDQTLGKAVQRLRGADVLEGDAMDVDESDDSWETCYYSLNAFLKVVTELPGLTYNSAAEPVWIHVRALLLHPHQWIRIVCNRLLGVFFQSVDAKTRIVVGGQSTKPHSLLATTEGLKEFGHALSSQLDSHLLTADLAKQIVKNMFFMGKCMYELDQTLDGANAAAGSAAVTAEPEVDEEDDEAAGDDVEDDQVEEATSAPKPSFQLLLALCRRVAFLCRADTAKKRGPLLRRSVFQWFAAMTNYIPAPKMNRYLFHMISTLYRTSKDESAKGADADELRLLADEVLGMIRKHVGTVEYLEMYNKVHLRVQEVRRERKAQRSIQAVVDPEARAKRRVQKNDMKRGSRKRKAEEFAQKKVKLGISKKIRH
ncbi:U3 snoRNP protein [Thoreauomyces humboldtii]|nr:U3 snoRNP protein [Thoreauomyces humboldtii]